MVAVTEALAEGGPNLGGPLVEPTKGANLHDLKESRSGSSGTSEVRVLVILDPRRSAILLVTGDKPGSWVTWYRDVIPRAEDLYAIYVKERAEEEGAQ